MDPVNSDGNFQIVTTEPRLAMGSLRIQATNIHLKCLIKHPGRLTMYVKTNTENEAALNQNLRVTTVRE